MSCLKGSVDTTPDELENGGFTLKTHHMFSVHTKPEEFKNSTIISHFGFVFEENSGRKITWLPWRHRYRIAPISKCFRSTRKWKVHVFKFLRFKERFRKAPLSWRISVDSRRNRRNKAAFPNSSGVVWKGLNHSAFSALLCSLVSEGLEGKSRFSLIKSCVVALGIYDPFFLKLSICVCFLVCLRFLAYPSRRLYIHLQGDISRLLPLRNYRSVLQK